jgi:class 3 adenylate cyclase
VEPRIQYAKTSDGVNIAFWTLGEGPPLILVWPSILSNIQLEWQLPEWRHWYQGLARRRMLVRYDTMGSGLSDRGGTDFSLDSHLREIEALVNRLRLDSFDALGLMQGGPVAIAWAAGHPGQISKLILLHSWARSSEIFRGPVLRGLEALRETDWDGWLETLTKIYLTQRDDEDARRYLVALREHVVPEVLRAHDAAFESIDVSSLLTQVTCPTLVLQRRQVRWPGVVDIARHLASQIPDARLALLEGESVATHLGDTDAILRAVDEFLSEGAEPDTKADLPEGMAAILFADIVESTALTERLGDAAFRAKARELDTSLRAIIRECSGTPVEGKLVGDGVLAVFTSARQAIECALRCNGAGESVGLQLHLGIHAGDVIREGNNVYGGAVNLAARIAAASEPGEVLVSDTVRSLARTSAGVSFDDRGEHELKGIEDPQRLFAVRGGADG